MKIVDNRKKEEVKCFSDIKVGETFKTKTSNAIYMKIHSIHSSYDDGWDYYYNEEANAICLNDGNAKVFMRSHSVIPLKCSCVIEE